MKTETETVVVKGWAWWMLFGLTILLVALICSGCVSQSSKSEDSNHYRAQVQPQVYLCENCGNAIPMENISANIRVKNACPNCGKIFFYTHVAKSNKAGAYQPGYYGRRVYGPSSSYQSDVSHQRFGVGGYSFKENQYGFTETYWYFRDSRKKSYRSYSRWTTTRYHYP